MLVVVGWLLIAEIRESTDCFTVVGVDPIPFSVRYVGVLLDIGGIDIGGGGGGVGLGISMVVATEEQPTLSPSSESNSSAGGVLPNTTAAPGSHLLPPREAEDMGKI